MRKLFLAALVAASFIGCERNYNDTTAIAKSYYNVLYTVPIKGVMCTQTDSDGDGYVTCDVSDTTGRVVSLQCPLFADRGSNCKSTQAKSTQPDR